MAVSTARQGRLGALLRRSGWGRAFLAYTFSRMSAGTVVFTLLLVGQRVQHHLSHGALAATGYGLAAAVSTPVVSRLADGRSVRRVLLTTTSLYALALGAVCALADHGALPLLVAATVAGALLPPVGPTFRATLTEAMPDPALRSTALTVESVLVELLQVGGPMLVTACVAVTAPQVALLLVAAGVLLGTLQLTRIPALRAKPVARRAGRERLFTSRVLALFAVWMLFTGALSAIEVVCVAFAGPHRVWLSGLGVAVLAGGSIVGGLAVASSPAARRPTGRLQAMLAAMAAVVALLAVAHLPALFIVVVGVAALGVAPSMGVIMTLLGEAVPAQRRNEAFGWMASANYVGAAVWTAAAGALVEHVHWLAAVLAAGSLALCVPLVVVGAAAGRHRRTVLSLDPVPDVQLVAPRQLASLTPEGGTA